MKRDYALVFRGHRFCYEVQAVAKLFFPGERFLLCEDGTVPDCDYILTEIRDGSILRVRLHLQGKEMEREHISRNEQEYALCRMLFDMLVTMTGYQPPWGMLTGIRPVRKLVQAVDRGMTMEEAVADLRERYLVSEEKLHLARQCALVQMPMLPHSPKEIGVYVSIPFCPTRCSYCSFVSHSMETAARLIPAYVEKLVDEIRVTGEIIREYGLRVHSLYVGGGTPTAIPAKALQCVLAALSQEMDLSGCREYTVEAGRPDTIDREKLAVIRDAGVSRISVNPQTLQDSVLQAIGRRHTAQQAIEAFCLAREMGFDDINMDLIAGLPTDTYEGFADTLARVMSLCPDSITVHTLTVKRAAALYQKAYHENTAIAEVERMTALSASALPVHGYQPYYLYRQKNTLGNLENVGYAKSGKENLYNILIMDETQTILGVGCAASTKVVCPDGDITRIMNYKFPYEYIDRFVQMMEKKQELRKRLADMETRYAEK